MEDTVALDTDILIDLLRGQAKTVKKLRALEDSNTLQTTTTVNAFELHHGAWKTDNPPRNLQAVETLLSRLTLLDFTPEAAATAGKILASLKMEGSTIELRDAFIAATVLEHGATLYTRNTRHFSRVPNLRLLEP